MKDKLKKYLLPNLPYLLFVYLFDKLCQAVRLAPGLDVSEKLLHIGQGFQTAFASSAPSFHVLDICVGIFGAILVRLAVYLKAKNAKKYRRGVEYGSARWGRPEDIGRSSQSMRETKIFSSSAAPAAARRGFLSNRLSCRCTAPMSSPIPKGSF